MAQDTKSKILVVDDRPANLLAMQAMLSSFDVELIEATSGEDALVKAREHTFALILLDVRLPGIDGITTAEGLRAIERARGVPIMFLTAFDRIPEQVDRAYALGAVDFLFKPIVPKILMAKIAVFIDLHKKKRANELQANLLRENEEREQSRRVHDERAAWEAAQLRHEVELKTRLAHEKERSATILNCIKEAVVAVDSRDCVLSLNHAAEQLFGVTSSSAEGTPVEKIVQLKDVETREPVPPREENRDLLAVSVTGEEHVVASSSGSIIDKLGTDHGRVFVYRDVTTQRRMERDINNHQRLESLGHLAAGIAHDFNNMLGMIMASATTLRRPDLTEEKRRELIESVEDTCERASGLARQLLTFSHGGAPVKELSNPEQLVRGTVEMSLKGGTTSCEFHFDGTPWPAELDPSQISQVFSNLAINAREAMGDRGNIVVHGRNRQVGPGDEKHLLPGPYIEFTVHDDGPGIASKDAELIFDPYFSTKSSHRGLGLSSAYSVVKRHGGLLKVVQPQEGGATFQVLLPARPDASAPEEVPPSNNYATGGHVLVMDDEERLRHLFSDFLMTIHCRVVTAANGEEALGAYRAALEEGDPFDAVVLDLTVRGGMGGADTLAQLKSIAPDVLAIACSGYANDPIMCAHEQFGFAAAIAKPFRFEPFARTVMGVVARNQNAKGEPNAKVSQA